MLTNIHVEKHRNVPVLDPDHATTRCQKEKAGKTHFIQVQAQYVARPMLATQVCHCKGIRKRSSAYAVARLLAVSLLAQMILSTFVGLAHADPVQSLDTSAEDRPERGNLAQLATQISPPVDEVRVALRIAYREIVPTYDPVLLLAFIDLEDDDVQRFSLALLLRSDLPQAPSRLEEFFGSADLAGVRWMVEQAPRLLRVDHLPAIHSLARRDDAKAGELAAELAARLPPAAAERVLLELIANPPSHPGALPAQLEALGRVGGLAAGECLARFRADPTPDVSEAARRAFSAVRQRLLAMSMLDQELALTREGLRWIPDDLDLRLLEARTVGLYMENAEEGLELLSRSERRYRPARWGDGSRSLASILLGRSVVQYFSGQAREAFVTLAEAQRALGRPPRHMEESALLVARIHLVKAIFALAGQAGLESARAEIKRAVAAAPYSNDVCLFDQSMWGTFGPLTLLDRLRRTGQTTTQIRFLRLVEEALLEDLDGLALGIAGDGEAEGLEPGSNRAALDAERVKSWIPLRRLQALANAGRLEAARAVGERVVKGLTGTTLWNNRELSAQCSLRLGWIHARSERPDEARSRYLEAQSVLEEIDHAFSRDELKQRSGRHPRGAAPYRPPYRTLRARALVGLAEVDAILLARPDRAQVEARKATQTDPWCNQALLADATAEAQTGRSDRAEVILDSLPRTADLLAGLSRLASACGRQQEADQLFETHLSWNALTEEIKAVEIRFRRQGSE